MAQTVEAMMEKELGEAQKTREDLLAKRQEIDDQLAALELRLQAFTNFRLTLEGKFATQQTTPPEQKPRRASGSRAPRGKRAELRERILDTIRQFPDSATAELINTELQADAKMKTAIANLLSLMKKEGIIAQKARRDPYTIAPPKQDEEPEAA